VANDIYSRAQMIDMEHQILDAVNFELTIPTAQQFHSRFMQLSDVEDDFVANVFSCYLLELTLVDFKMLRFRPSLLASASIYLAKKMLRRGRPFTAEM